VKAGEAFDVTVTVGKEVPHPNTIEHHIKWVEVYARKGKTQVAAEVARFDFGPTYADPKVTFKMMLERSATVYALEYCNMHGVWENSVDIEVE
jgi:superoxide reductase